MKNLHILPGGGSQINADGNDDDSEGFPPKILGGQAGSVEEQVRVPCVYVTENVGKTTSTFMNDKREVNKWANVSGSWP